MTQAEKTVNLGNLGARIREARDLKGWTLEKLGDLVGNSGSTISDWERNKTEPKRRDIAKLCASLEVSPAWLTVGYGPRVHEDQAPYGVPSTQPDEEVVLNRTLPGDGKPSTRADCEAYFQKLMELAHRSGKPNAFPVIYDTLETHLPLRRWMTESEVTDE